MLQDSLFRELLEEDEDTKYEIGMETFDQYVSRIDFAILGFLWCEGEKEEKAKFLFELANSNQKKSKSFSSPGSPMKSQSQPRGSAGIDEENIIIWTNRNMKYIFGRMF